MKTTSRLLAVVVSAVTILFSLQPGRAAVTALWRFENAGGSQVDSSANSNTATSMNGATQVFDLTRSSGTMSYDGVDDFLQVAHSSSLAITGDMTLALWVNVTSSGGFGQWRGLVAKDPAGSGNPAPYQFWFNQGFSLIPAFGRGDGTAQDFAFGSVSASTGVWQHWAVTMSGTTATMFLNGVPISMSDSLISTTIADQGGVLVIGDRPGAQDMSFLGRMDDVAIFNEALTQTQIQTIMGGDFSGFGIAVPEPSRTFLLLGGLLMAGCRRRRR